MATNRSRWLNKIMSIGFLSDDYKKETRKRRKALGMKTRQNKNRRRGKESKTERKQNENEINKMNSFLVVLSSFTKFLLLPLFQLFPTINRLLCKVSLFSAILTSVIRLVLFFHLNLSHYLDAKVSSTIHLPKVKKILKGALMLTQFLCHQSTVVRRLQALWKNVLSLQNCFQRKQRNIIKCLKNFLPLETSFLNKIVTGGEIDIKTI